MGGIQTESIISSRAKIGPGTKIWHFAQVREHAVIGTDCTISKGCYIDEHVTIGNRVKIQNNVSVYRGVTIRDEVFVGPHVCFTNDRVPRACTPKGKPKEASDWHVTPTIVEEGASIGANATILAGVTIGRHALVGAGAVVTKNVHPHTIVVGNPARAVGRICACGATRASLSEELVCAACNTKVNP